MVQAQHDIAVGLPVLSIRRTVADWLNHWCDEIIKPKARPMTYVAYRNMLDRHLVPCLGSKVLAKLTASDVRAFLNAKSTETFTRKTARKDQPKTKVLSARTVKHFRDVLRAALNCAVKDGVLVKNVAAHMEVPRVEHKQQSVWSATDAENFMKAVQGHRFEALFWLAVATGLRKGELLGLTWDAIDLERLTIKVRQQVQRVGGKILISPPKTEKSRREIHIPPFLRPILEAHRKRQALERDFAGENWKEHGLVFTWAVGTPFDLRAINRIFDSLIKVSKVPRIRVHDLRHSDATILIQNRVPIHTVSDILGHSTPTVTINVYAHVLDAMRVQAADTMEAIFQPAANQLAPRLAPTAEENGGTPPKAVQ